MKKGITNYRIYKALNLNPGNVNAFLKNASTSKMSSSPTVCASSERGLSIAAPKSTVLICQRDLKSFANAPSQGARA